MSSKGSDTYVDVTSFIEKDISTMRFAKVVEVGDAHRSSRGHPDVLRRS